MLEFIKSRRTIRKFEQMPLSGERLAAYVDAARVAPSAANRQPLKYVVVHSPQMVGQVFPLLKWAGYLPDYAPKEGERPTAYVVMCVDKDISPNGADLDVGAAAENIILSALADGVGTCWLASVDRPKLVELLELPSHLTVSGVLALGYPKECPREAELETDVKYYLEGDTLCVPKRSLDEVLLKTI